MTNKNNLPLNQPKKKTGKQLITALKKAVKNNILRSPDFSCLLGSWGDQYPTLRFKIALGDDKHARFEVEVQEVPNEGHGKISDMQGDTKNLDVVNVVRVSSVLFEEDDVWPNTIVNRDGIKDIDLLEKYIKETFDGLRITTYETDGEYDGETYAFK